MNQLLLNEENGKFTESLIFLDFQSLSPNEVRCISGLLAFKNVWENMRFVVKERVRPTPQFIAVVPGW